MESRVVLICLKPYLSPSQINDKTISSMFSQFAQVTNVSIFACTSVLKAFVEFETPAIARLAVEHLNGRQFNFGSVHVYPSNKSCIKPKPPSSFNNKTSSQNPQLPQETTSGKQKSDSYSVDNSDPSSSDNMPANELAVIGGLLYSQAKHTNTKELSGFMDMEHSNSSKQSRHAPHLRHNQPILPKISNSLLPGQASSRTSSEDQIANCYVQVTGLNSQIVNAKILMNLLCCFGNVKNAIFSRSEGTAHALYSSGLEALAAIHYLNSQRFFGAAIELKDSLLTSTEIAKCDFAENGYTFIDGRTQHYRYKSSLRIRFNAPSSLLHFTNLPGCCTAPILYQIVCAVREPMKIMKLARRNSKDAGMMLVEFDSPSSALEVLSVLHNKKINDNVIRVSFSQTKIPQSR
jgi:RNA recognition motif-containing protein